MTTTVERLEAAVRPADAPAEPTEGWAVRDMDTAAWASRKAAEAQREINRVDAWEQREIERVRNAAATERARFERDLEFFAHALAAYLQSLIHAGRKTRTLNLPGGTIRLRARPTAFDLDEQKALEWARVTHPDLLRVRESLDKAAFKRLVALGDSGTVIDPETGEVLDWARWSDPGDGASFEADGSLFSEETS
jgi:phage host-nuclease inhibitor protein Gam